MYGLRHLKLELVGCNNKVTDAPLWTCMYPEHTQSEESTVDREIFAVKNFSPVAWVAKIKHTKI